jgi:hypothetical protein
MNFQTLQALIFIIKALIQMFQFLTGKIKADDFHKSMDSMKASIEKASSGPLETRIEGGKEIEDQFNQHVGKK